MKFLNIILLSGKVVSIIDLKNYVDRLDIPANKKSGKAKGGAVFKEKDYVNLSNIKDNLKKKWV